MNQSKVTVRYSKAFFNLAKEKKQLDTLRKDIELIYTLCNESADFRILLESPIVKTSQKTKLLKAIFEKKIAPLSLNFLELVTTNKREAQLAGICRNLLTLYRQEQGVKTALLTTAVDLDPALIADIQKKLEAQFQAQIELSQKVDPALVGGFILRVEDQQVDASIARQLQKVRETLLQSEIK
ncbi:ATP synthase F1 subunit delta [Mangrovibacterium marinum]|uniref:ATP synthase subunit delta n=1 Tax=Mangrovibacterium marinum TaxID=1639118 RepID=A0A2T5C6G3_9BACT|nr:ATP synthase F1 subunit delta [Mangrovibacterium marinum]PTN10516.1 ATP synthase F1 subcomplex delta subunit [Mangrovibacterium marinum]